MLRSLVSFLVLALCISSSHSFTPYSATYHATWKAKWFPITVEGIRTLKNLEDNSWQLSFEAYSSVADLSEISVFKINNKTILPQSYRYKTTGFLSKKHRLQEFKWEENKVWLPKKDLWANYELQKGVQDNLSYQEQIRLDLKQGKTEFYYPVTYKNRLKHYYFETVGETQLQLQNKTITAIEVKQIKLKHPKEATRIWFAKDYDYLLVQLEKTKKNGNRNSIKLKKAHLNGQTLLGFKKP
jgi:hypothetical protein